MAPKMGARVCMCVCVVKQVSYLTRTHTAWNFKASETWSLPFWPAPRTECSSSKLWVANVAIVGAATHISHSVGPQCFLQPQYGIVSLPLRHYLYAYLFILCALGALLVARQTPCLIKSSRPQAFYIFIFTLFALCQPTHTCILFNKVDINI